MVAIYPFFFVSYGQCYRALRLWVGHGTELTGFEIFRWNPPGQYGIHTSSYTFGVPPRGLSAPIERLVG